MMSIKQLPNLYEACKTTLEKTSKDDSNKKISPQYISNSQLEVYNFDKVKEVFEKNHNFPTCKSVGSCDALYINKNDNEFYLIEFKNTHLRGLKNKKPEIREKFFGSLLILTDIVAIGISKTRKVVHFILVYSDAKQQIKNEIGIRSESESEEFSFKKYENIYYKKCLRLNDDEFQKRFANQWEIENDEEVM